MRATTILLCRSFAAWLRTPAPWAACTLGARFFIRVDSLNGIDRIDGNGRVPPATTAEIHWLRPERYIESNHPEIVHIARSLRAKSAVETAHAAFRWVRRTRIDHRYAVEGPGVHVRMH